MRLVRQARPGKGGRMYAPRSTPYRGVVSRRVSGGLLVVAATLLSAGSFAAREPTCVVAYDDDRLTVHAEGAPLADVVREIGRQSGAEVVGEVRKPRAVRQSLDRVPLVDALVRLLGEQNFTLRYGPEGKLLRIHLLGEPLAAAAQTTPADASNRGREEPAWRHRHRDVRSSRETLPDGQVVVTVAGTDTRGRDASSGSPEDPARLSQQGATTQDWPAPDERDRKLRRHFLDLLAQMDEATRAQYFTTPEGQKAQALLEDFAAHHPPGRSSQKANDILSGQASQTPAGSISRPPGSGR